MSDYYVRLPAAASKSWKTPVANAAALPITGNNDGDARVTLNDQSIYVWKAADSSWQQAATPAATSAITALNGEGSANGPGAVTLTLSNAAVIAKVLTGLNSTPGVLSAADSILNGIGKLNGNVLAISGSATSIGALDSQAANAAGLTLTSNVLSAQSADITHPGLVNTVTQQFNGFKQFNGGGIGTDVVNDLNNVMAWDVASRIFKGTAGQSVINLPSFLLLDNNGNHSVDWNNDLLKDSNDILSFNWLSRQFSSPNGQVKLSYSDSTVLVTPGAANNIPLIVRGFASQSANLQEWQDSALNALSNVAPDGSLNFLQANIVGASDYAAINSFSSYTATSLNNIYCIADQSLTTGATLSTQGFNYDNRVIIDSTISSVYSVKCAPSFVNSNAPFYYGVLSAVSLFNGNTVASVTSFADESNLSGSSDVNFYTSARFAPFLSSDIVIGSYFGINISPEIVSTATAATGILLDLSSVNATTKKAIIVEANSGNSGFGTNTPDISAIIEVASTAQGFLPPRMTTTQKNAISSPAEGLIVYDITLHKLCVRGVASWETITSI